MKTKVQDRVDRPFVVYMPRKRAPLKRKPTHDQLEKSEGELALENQRRLRAEFYERESLSVGYCRNGHRRTPKTTYVQPSGKRECRVCKTERDARRLA